MKKFTILFLVFAFLLAACGTSATATLEAAVTPVPANEVIAEGHLVPARDATLSFQARGTVTEVNAKISKTVKKGDLLARLGTESDAAYAAAQAELISAQKAYDDFVRIAPLDHAQAWQAYMDAQIIRAAAARKWENLDVSNIENRIEDAKAEIEDRQSDLKDAQDEFDKYKNLDPENSKRKTAEDNLENAQNDLNEAIRKLEAIERERDTVRAALDLALAAESEAKRNFENSLDGPDKVQLALIEARLNAAKAQVAAFSVFAPFDGMVMDVNVAAGEQAGPEAWAVKIADTSAWYVETSDLTELEVVKIAVGQKASILPDALSDAKMTGVVESISQAFISQGGDILYRVKIKVDEVDPRVLWGMTVEVTFEPLK